MESEILELTNEQKLEERGFRYLRTSGHIIMREEVWDLPRNEDGLPLPVGYMAGRSLFLVNLNEKFPKDYHAQLRQLYQEARGSGKQ